jgi:hypothetical protein
MKGEEKKGEEKREREEEDGSSDLIYCVMSGDDNDGAM